MHLFLVASGSRLPEPSALQTALARAAARIPALADADRWSLAASHSGLVAAGLHHAAWRCRPRRYRDVGADGAVTLYDGFPLLDVGGAPWDAAALAGRWQQLPVALEGACCVLRLRPDRGDAELLTDPIGMVPVYRAAFEGGWAISNSLLALRSLLDRHELDEEAAATYLSIGWALGERTIVRGVAVVPGGSHLRLSPAGVDQRRHFGPETVARVLGRGSPPIEELSRRLVGLIEAGPAAAAVPISAALTGGRDSRVCLALLRAAGVDAAYFTGGARGERDVEIARALAARLDLRHTSGVAPVADLPVRRLIESFVDQNDGMASLEGLRDHTAQLDVPDQVGVVVSGMGGEMIRGGSSPLVAFTANARPVADLRAFQRRFARLKIRDGGGLVRGETLASARRQLDASLDRFAAAGWPTRMLTEAFYVFERIGKWGTTSVRRTAATADLLSPLATRAVLEYGMAGSPGDRYVEATHRDLLGHLDAALRDAPFEVPWHPRRPRLAPVSVAGQGAKLAARRISARVPRRRRAHEPAPVHQHMSARVWHALRPEYRAALERAGEDNPVYALIDRGAVHRAVAGDVPPPDAVHRAVTITWALTQR